MTIHLRYFAHTDSSPIGKVGLAYCEQLLALGHPLRLVPITFADLTQDARGDSDSVWASHRQLLVAPMPGAGVNVVCGRLDDLRRLHTVGMPNWALLTSDNLAESRRDVAAVLDRYNDVYAVSRALAEDVARDLGLHPKLLEVRQ
jgi:hypothetical protein